jgi:hypothetical protein
LSEEGTKKILGIEIEKSLINRDRKETLRKKSKKIFLEFCRLKELGL